MTQSVADSPYFATDDDPGSIKDKVSSKPEPAFQKRGAVSGVYWTIRQANNDYFASFTIFETSEAAKDAWIKGKWDALRSSTASSGDLEVRLTSVTRPNSQRSFSRAPTWLANGRMIWSNVPAGEGHEPHSESGFSDAAAIYGNIMIHVLDFATFSRDGGAPDGALTVLIELIGMLDAKLNFHGDPRGNVVR